jgi:hypothetical protein
MGLNGCFAVNFCNIDTIQSDSIQVMIVIGQRVFVSGVPRYDQAAVDIGRQETEQNHLPEDVHKLFCQIDDERHLTAHKLYEDIHRRMKKDIRLLNQTKHKKSKA